MKIILSALLILASATLSTTSEAQSGRRRTSPSYPPPAPIDSTQSYEAPATTSSYGYGSRSSSLIITPALGFFGAGDGTLIGTLNGTATGVPNWVLSGLFGIGGGVEFMVKDTMSFGGFLRYYSSSDTLVTTEVKNSLLTIGGTVKGYFTSNDWLLEVGAGFALLSPSVKSGPNEYSIDMGFGIPVVTGLFYKMSNTFALGVENTRIMGLGEKYNGWILDDMMFVGRLSL